MERHVLLTISFPKNDNKILTYYTPKHNSYILLYWRYRDQTFSIAGTGIQIPVLKLAIQRLFWGSLNG